MAYILLFSIFSNTYNGLIYAPASAEFSNQTSCDNAIQAMKADRRSNFQWAICVPKSSDSRP